MTHETISQVFGGCVLRLLAFLAVLCMPLAAMAVDKAPLSEQGNIVTESVLLQCEPYSMLSISFRPDVVWNTQPGQYDALCERMLISALAADKSEAKILYPTFAVDRVGAESSNEIILTLIAFSYGQTPQHVTIADPLSSEKVSCDLTILPATETLRRKELLAQWIKTWDRKLIRRYYRKKRNHLIPAYIQHMIATRCEAEDAQLKTLRRFSYKSHHPDLLQLLSGADSLHQAMQTSIMLGETDSSEKADLPVPASVNIPKANLPPIAGDIEIEEMAMRVPQECFYTWFPSWDDFEWFLDESERFGSRARDIIGEKPLDYMIRARIEGQIALRQTLIARIFGPKIIESVAFIGTDPFVREGATLGLVFHAKNSKLLADHINKQRRKMAISDDLAIESTVNIDGLEVSLLARADNIVRSYYVIDGDWHLVTNSRYLAERFISTGRGEKPLGDSEEFHWARSKMPVSRGDNAFVFLSDEFMRNLTGGKYRIEMNRRDLARNRIALAKVARLCAMNETGKNLTLAELVAQGYLPADFNQAPDGGQIVSDEQGNFACSLRGASGTFTPIADMQINGITESEKKAWDRYERNYRQIWENLDPAMLAVSRGEDEDGNERVSIDLMQTPYPIEKYRQFTNFLCKASKVFIKQPADNLLSAQLSISPTAVMQSRGGGLFGSNSPLSRVLMHNVFAGIQDFEVELPPIKLGYDVDDLMQKTFHDDDSRKTVNAYIGESPMPQLLLMLGAGMAEADELGYYEVDEFVGRSINSIHALGMNRETLESVTPQLKISQADRPAQARLAVSQLSDRNISPFLKTLLFLKALKGTTNNTIILNDAAKLLGIEPEKAQSEVEGLLNAAMVCPLGGKYVSHRSADGGIEATAIPDLNKTNGRIPNSYHPELFEMFRGGLLEFSTDPENQILQVHIEYKLDK